MIFSANVTISINNCSSVCFVIPRCSVPRHVQAHHLGAQRASDLDVLETPAAWQDPLRPQYSPGPLHPPEGGYNCHTPCRCQKILSALILVSQLMDTKIFLYTF